MIGKKMKLISLDTATGGNIIFFNIYDGLMMALWLLSFLFSNHKKIQIKIQKTNKTQKKINQNV